jgi:uncharacterized protein (DUF1778 family)
MGMLTVRCLTDHAAEVTGKKRSDFILDAARVAAEIILLDRRTIQLNAIERIRLLLPCWTRRPSRTRTLRKSLTAPAIWE